MPLKPDQISELRSRMLEALLERMPCGALLVTRQGELLHASPRARLMLGREDVLSLRRGHLQCRAASDHRALLDALGTTSTSKGPSETLLSLPSSELPEERVAIVISGLADGPLDSGSRAAEENGLLVLVSDPDDGSHPSADHIRALFDLTKAESRLAAALACGQDLEEYASEVGISVGTARWTLKNVFLKTGTDRQVELVRLVLGSVAAFHRLPTNPGEPPQTAK